MTSQYLFVYGTLRRATNNDMSHLLQAYATFVGNGTYQGRLYKIDYYPGAVPSDNPNDRVNGEVYKLNKPDVVLPELDKYEECGAGFKEPAEYVRKKQRIHLINGEDITAWVYIYNRPTDNLTFISSGDFIKK